MGEEGLVQEGANDDDGVVEVNAVRYTQRSMKHRIQDGRALEDLIELLNQGLCDPLKATYQDPKAAETFVHESPHAFKDTEIIAAIKSDKAADKTDVLKHMQLDESKYSKALSPEQQRALTDIEQKTNVNHIERVRQARQAMLGHYMLVVKDFKIEEHMAKLSLEQEFVVVCNGKRTKQSSSRRRRRLQIRSRRQHGGPKSGMVHTFPPLS